MKTVFVSLILLMGVNMAFGQKVKIKNDMVYVDKQEYLTVDGKISHILFRDLQGKELFFMNYITTSKYGEEYCRVIFLEQELTLTVSSFMFSRKMLVKELIKNKALENGKLNPEQVRKFVLKYDERIEQAPVNVNVSVN